MAKKWEIGIYFWGGMPNTLESGIAKFLVIFLAWQNIFEDGLAKKNWTLWQNLLVVSKLNFLGRWDCKISRGWHGQKKYGCGYKRFWDGKVFWS